MFEMDHGIFPCMNKKRTVHPIKKKKREKEQAHVLTKKNQVKGSNELVIQ